MSKGLLAQHLQTNPTPHFTEQRFSNRLPCLWNLYIVACLHTYLRSYLLTYLHTYLLTYLLINTHAYVLHESVQSYLYPAHLCIDACIAAYVHACIHTNMHKMLMVLLDTYFYAKQQNLCTARFPSTSAVLRRYINLLIIIKEPEEKDRVFEVTL